MNVATTIESDSNTPAHVEPRTSLLLPSEIFPARRHVVFDVVR
jgi:hypothetical protein